MKIVGLDHIVLNVGDIDRSLKFYTEVLGLKGERVDEFRAGKVGFPSVRINQTTIIDLFPRKPGTDKIATDKVDGNLNHFCLVVDKENFVAVLDDLRRGEISVGEGPVSRWGAQGQATSVYFLDPDGNEIEIRCY
ncbi:MAG: VOC family virulence protein [Deltaproteobacteria bacterium]|nr:VOC family virulence protein [Deltaproteobacteria bacterium]